MVLSDSDSVTTGATSCNRNVSSLTEWVLASTCSRQSEVCTKDVWCERLLSRDDQGMDITRSGHGYYLSEVNACSPVMVRPKIRAWTLLVWCERLLSRDGATQDQGMDITCLMWTLVLPWWRDPRSGHGYYLSEVNACSPMMARPKIRAWMLLVWCERLLSGYGASQDQSMDVTCLKWTLALPWWRDPRSEHGCHLSEVNACSPLMARPKIRAWTLLVWCESLLSRDGATQDQGMYVMSPWNIHQNNGYTYSLHQIKMTLSGANTLHVGLSLRKRFFVLCCMN